MDPLLDLLHRLDGRGDGGGVRVDLQRNLEKTRIPRGQHNHAALRLLRTT